MHTLTPFVFAVLLISIDQPSDDLVNAATTALRKKQPQEALNHLNKAIDKDQDHIAALSLRASILEKLGKHMEATRDYRRIVELIANRHQVAGAENFKAGKIKESIDDFDKYIELQPQAKISHWQRGISYYYAGHYDNGRRQFEGYQDYDSNDVENAVWRFMCMARKDGVAKARTDMLKIGD